MGSRTYRIDSKRNKQDKSKIIRKSDIESISELRSITKVVKPCWEAQCLIRNMEL